MPFRSVELHLIQRGAEQLEWNLEKLLEMTLRAMAECEDEIREAVQRDI